MPMNFQINQHSLIRILTGCNLDSQGYNVFSGNVKDWSDRRDTLGNLSLRPYSHYILDTDQVDPDQIDSHQVAFTLD